MSVGIAGAHRSGKSTLAKAYAEKYGIHFLETSASAVFERMGLSPKIDYGLDTRIEIQENILKEFAAQYRAACDDAFITDRTPVDLMAYMMSDVQRENVSAEQSKRIMAYLKECASVTNQFFTTIVVLQPGIPMVETPGKAPANIAYVEHISALVLGIVVGESILTAHYYIPRHVLSMAARISSLEQAVGRTYEKHSGFIASSAEQGRPVCLH